jgi:hypothetical protein
MRENHWYNKLEWVKERPHKNFCWSELIVSNSFSEIPNIPDERQREDIRKLLYKWVVPLRNEFGRIAIGGFLYTHSCYRGNQVNFLVGGKRNSEHLFKVEGEGAFDIRPLDANLEEIFIWASRNIPSYTGIIIYPERGFMHIGNSSGREGIQIMENIRGNLKLIKKI